MKPANCVTYSLHRILSFSYCKNPLLSFYFCGKRKFQKLDCSDCYPIITARSYIMVLFVKLQSINHYFVNIFGYQYKTLKKLVSFYDFNLVILLVLVSFTYTVCYLNSFFTYFSLNNRKRSFQRTEMTKLYSILFFVHKVLQGLIHFCQSNY